MSGGTGETADAKGRIHLGWHCAACWGLVGSVARRGHACLDVTVDESDLVQVLDRVQHVDHDRRRMLRRGRRV